MQRFFTKRSLPGPWPLYTALLFLCLAGGWLVASASLSFLLVMFVVILGTTALWPIWHEIRLGNSVNWFAPITLIAIFFFLDSTLVPLGWLAGVQNSPADQWTILKAMLLQLLSMVVLYVAYYATGNAQPSVMFLSLGKGWNLSRLRVAVLLLVAIGLFGAYVQFSSAGGVSALFAQLANTRWVFGEMEYVGYTTWLMQLASVGALIYSIYAFEHRRELLAALGLLLLVIAIFVLRGRRSPIVTIAWTLLAYLNFSRRRPFSTKTFVSAGGVALAFTMLYRVVFREYLPLGELFSPFELATGEEAVWWEDLWSRSITGTFTSLNYLSALLSVFTVRSEFELGRTLLGYLTLFIPRAWFPAKLPVTAELFSQTFFPASWARGTGHVLGLSGEMYWNFGIPGIVGGFLLTGWLLRLAHNHFLEHRGAWAERLVYALLSAHIIWLLRSGIGGMLPWLMSSIPAIFVTYLIARDSSGTFLGSLESPRSHAPKAKTWR